MSAYSRPYCIWTAVLHSASSMDGGVWETEGGGRSERMGDGGRGERRERCVYRERVKDTYRSGCVWEWPTGESVWLGASKCSVCLLPDCRNRLISSTQTEYMYKPNILYILPGLSTIQALSYTQIKSCTAPTHSLGHKTFFSQCRASLLC